MNSPKEAGSAGWPTHVLLAQLRRSALAIHPPPGCVLMERSPQDKPAHLCYAAPPCFTTATAKERVGFKVPLVPCDHDTAVLGNTSSQLFQLPFLSLEKAFTKSRPCETGSDKPLFHSKPGCASPEPGLLFCACPGEVRYLHPLPERITTGLTTACAGLPQPLTSSATGRV